ncbi:DUF2961 domain-containing protein [Fodinicola acaciae]|uniref:DUF2961 domain-containing protein n=1 Tax=Fodinicola acaciae TaxID=2681555 RepID=UPI0013D4FAAA|nr:DUF2961 domain-containing protein [Fodinicola acaciae]
MPAARSLLAAALASAFALTATAPAYATEPAGPPPLYLGLDSYLHWDKLPYLEIGDRVGGQSSADPGGSNTDNVTTFGASPFGGRVLFDQAGPGVVTFMRMQEEIGGPWATRNPVFLAPLKPADLGQTSPTTTPASTLPYPLSLNVNQSQGSSIVATSIPYATNMQFMSSAANGNFYAMYRKLAVDTPLPEQTATATSQATALLRSAGTDIAPKDIPTAQGTVALPTAGAAVPVASIDGSNQLRAISFHVPYGQKVRFGNSRLRIYWDGETTPSVDAPVKYLTGDGAGVYKPAGRQLVAGLPANITSDGSTYMDFSLYWPMPFGSNARIELVPSAAMDPVGWSVRYEPFSDPLSWVGRFHANYTDIPTPQAGRDMTFLDYQGSGKLVGTVINFGAVGATLEGDPHIYVDGSKTPQLAVTGTEEWGMGGDYWHNGNQTSLPMAGLPSSTNNPAGSDVDGAAEYRFLIADSVPFTNHLRVDWEHGVVNDNTQPYKATMLWYGTPTVTATPTDQLAVASPGDHGYQSPSDQLSPLTAAYEYTSNSPLLTDTVARMTTSTTFTMSLHSNNAGAFLRRTFNSCVANQRAKAYVDGQPAGTWYNAGVSRKTGYDGHDRCWRDDDFPLPKSLTAGKNSITIRIDNDTLNQPDRVWTAASYQLFSFDW